MAVEVLLHQLNEKSKMSHLMLLPDELKIKLCSYLNSFDVVELGKAVADFERVSYDKDVIRQMRLQSEYRFRIHHINSILLNPFRVELIVSLNINCIYWIAEVDLLDCILHMYALESLHALDTSLSFSENACNTYACLTNLRTLALSCYDNTITHSSISLFPKRITRMCVHVSWCDQSTVPHLCQMISGLAGLTELWVMDISLMDNHCMRMLSYVPASVRKLTIFTANVANMIGIAGLPFDKTVTFKSSKFGQQMCLEDMTEKPITDIYTDWPLKEFFWNVLVNQFKYELPFGPRDSLKLIHGSTPIDKVPFTELNLFHAPPICSSGLIMTMKCVVWVSNLKNSLRKLSINVCCQSYMDLHELVVRCPLLEELELWGCTYGSDQSVFALQAFENLVNLKRLTLYDLPQRTKCSGIVNV